MNDFSVNVVFACDTLKFVIQNKVLVALLTLRNLLRLLEIL